MHLMTTAELASYLRLKERAVYELASKRQIPCTRASGKLLFPQHLIDRWLESHTDIPQIHIAPPPPIYAGSSDPLLDWALRESGGDLAVLTSGSYGGLKRLADGQAVIAGVHIVDPEKGTYNISAIRRELPFPDIVAIHWATRSQGLLVASGNPKELADIADVAAKMARLALRPTNAGSRLLFDTLIERAGFDPASFVTCEREPRTETDLATMIADGEADCGIGIEAVAKRLGLGFVPLGLWEEFDLVMRRRDYFAEPVQKLLAFTRTGPFCDRAAALEGYDTTRLGEVVFNS